MSMPFDRHQQVHYDEDGLPVPPPVQPYASPAPMYAAQPKSWVAALLLTFFLGHLGVHNFYLGHTRRGVAQLSLTILGLATTLILVGFVFLAVVSVWVLIDLIMLLLRSGSMATDANGVPLN